MTVRLAPDQIRSADTIHRCDRGQEGIDVINVLDEVAEHFPALSLMPSWPPSPPALPVLRQCLERRRPCQEAILNCEAESRDEPGKLLFALNSLAALKTRTEKNPARVASSSEEYQMLLGASRRINGRFRACPPA